MSDNLSPVERLSSRSSVHSFCRGCSAQDDAVDCSNVQAPNAIFDFRLERAATRQSLLQHDMAPSTSSTRHRDVSSGASSSSSLSGSPYTIVVSDGGASHLVSFAQGSLSFSLCHPSPADPTSRVDTRRPNPFPTKPLPLENVVFVRIRQQAIDFINSTSNAAQGMMPIVFEVLYMGRGPSAGVSIFNLITGTFIAYSTTLAS